MALNINTNITNNLDGYLLDAKNVKGTYVVVDFESDLEALPSECLVDGSMAYVVNPSSEGSNFFRYNGVNWSQVVLEDKYITIAIEDTFSIKDYTFTFDNLTLGYALERRIALSDITLSFSDKIIVFSLNGIVNKTNYTLLSSQLLIYDNKQYIMTLSINLASQSNNATLSFQEIEGGSGGGGTTITKKWYEFKFADGMITSNEIIFKLNEDNFNYIVGMINAMMKQQDPTWQDISTPQELVALYDQLKLLNDSTTILGLAGLLYDGALDSDTIPYFYRDEFQKREILNSDMYVAGTTSTQNATPYCFLIVDANDNHTYEYVNLNASSTLVITETEETIGGGGSSEGSGNKIYTFKLEWDSSDDNTKRECISFTVNQNVYEKYYTYFLGSQISGPNAQIDIPLDEWENVVEQKINAGGQDASDILMLLMLVVYYIAYNRIINFTYLDDESHSYELATSQIYNLDLSIPNVIFYYYNGNNSSSKTFSIATILQSNPTFTLLGTVGGASNGGSGEGGSIESNIIDIKFTAPTSPGYADTTYNFLHIYMLKNDFEDFLTANSVTKEQLILNFNSLNGFAQMQFLTTTFGLNLGKVKSLYCAFETNDETSLRSRYALKFETYIDYNESDEPISWRLDIHFLTSTQLNTVTSDSEHLILGSISENEQVDYPCTLSIESLDLVSGTSGGGGGASGATRTKYHIEVEDSNGNKAIIPIYQDTFEDYLVEFNQVGQTMATAMGITWTTINNIAEFKTLFDTQKATQYAYGCDLGMNLLVKYAYESGENPVLSIPYLIGNRKIFSVQSLLNYYLAQNFLGCVLSIDDETMNTNTVFNWFKNAPTDNTNDITIDSNATFTYTEEQVAGGGSSGGEVATKKWYEWVLSTSQDITQARADSAYHNILNIKMSEDTWNIFKTDYATVLQQYNITQPSDFVTVFDQIKLSGDYTFSGYINQMYIMLGLVCEYCIKDNSIPFTKIENDVSGQNGFGIVNRVDGDSGFFKDSNGNTTTLDYSEADKNFFVDQYSTLTITEETETVSGGSSSTQPTIPERFSLAYNLVVNINQEQFANGSWTGSNSDNIRTFQYNGSNADETKAKELVEFLTGVNVLDSYNATKPTPCFVFCTQSNICWKLQWDNSLLHAYKVENFPFVVKEKYYNIVLNDFDDNNLPVSLQINIRYGDMQDVYNSINQVLGGNISTPQEVIAVYDSLKADNISNQSYNLLCQLFVGLASVNMLHNLNNLFSDSDSFTKIIGIGLANISVGGGVFIFSQTLNSNKISFTSTSTLLIHERDNPNELD